MTYSVIDQFIDEATINEGTTNEPTTIAINLELDEAIKIAETECGKDGHNIFIEWFRPSDGQHGYYNRDGHAITGQAW